MLADSEAPASIAEESVDSYDVRGLRPLAHSA